MYYVELLKTDFFFPYEIVLGILLYRAMICAHIFTRQSQPSSVLCVGEWKLLSTRVAGSDHISAAGYIQELLTSTGPFGGMVQPFRGWTLSWLSLPASCFFAFAAGFYMLQSIEQRHGAIRVHWRWTELQSQGRNFCVSNMVTRLNPLCGCSELCDGIEPPWGKTLLGNLLW